MPNRLGGWVINEAMSLGLPAIVSECVMAREMVQHNENGFVVRRKNKDDLVEAMVKLLAMDDASLKSFSDKAVLVASRFNLSYSVNCFREGIGYAFKKKKN